MKSDSRKRYEQTVCNIHKALDALTRADDGCSVRNWDCLTLGYCTDQLCRANAWIVQALMDINAETDGRYEGEGERKSANNGKPETFA